MRINSVKKRIGIILFFSLCIPSLSFSQNRQGNIVEYFGKEKVVDVHEGAVHHVFKEGLILRKGGFRFSEESVLRDPLLARILTEGKAEISEGRNEILDGQSLEWTPIKVGDKNEFNDPGLRSGYLYLEYDAPKSMTVLFEASGHTFSLINGLPHEGDHYDFGWQLIPVKLKKGKNYFLLTAGRFPRMRARILHPNHPVQFTKRDMTLPDLLLEERDMLWGGIRVVNTQEEWFKGGMIVCEVEGNDAKTTVPTIAPMMVRKVPFKIPTATNLGKLNEVKVVVKLLNSKGKELHADTIPLNVKSKFKHHKRTFISGVDGSVQYYSIAPSTNKDLKKQAMFLSVHGASVEATNQARAYKQKDWGHLVAPTNRRPFGFAWEDWGRLDALEVLVHSENLLGTDPQHTYLTGHSMGGHGTWYLGATYPDRWAAIAPCAGYPDLLEYRGSFMRRIKNMPETQIERFGMTKEDLMKMANAATLTDSKDILMDSMVRRAGTPSRTLKLKRNYLHHGVYVLHGEDDTVVPTFLARDMRERLGKFHNDFTYYEYPNGTHWYGDHSVDWPPIFDFFKARSIVADKEIDEIEFYTGSPGVSASSHFITILQQQVPFEVSSFKFERTEESIGLTTINVATLGINLEEMAAEVDQLEIDNQIVTQRDNKGMLYLAKRGEQWRVVDAPSLKEKGPHRNGGFKDAFRHNLVLVFASKGSQEENEWYYNRTKLDAEKFWYRANGNVEIVKDTDFSLEKYTNRNVVLYGNKDNNAAWALLLKNCPVQVSDGQFKVGNTVLLGNQWGAYFIYPRPDSDFASVGVVTATGNKGMKGAYANDYLVNGTTFPDLLLFDDSMMRIGLKGVKCTGFFGNDWSVEKSDFVWR